MPGLGQRQAGCRPGVNYGARNEGENEREYYNMTVLAV